jgi:hypothetical protein
LGRSSRSFIKTANPDTQENDMKRKYGYLLACLALVGALALTSQALGDKGSSGNSKSNTEAVHRSGDDNGNQQAHKRHNRRHRHHAKRAASKKLEGTVTTVDSGAKTITLALDDRGTDTNRTAVVHVPDTAKFATGDKVELFVKGSAADGSFTLVRADDRRDDVRQNDDDANHDVGDDHGGDRHGGGDNSGPGRGGHDD